MTSTVLKMPYKKYTRDVDDLYSTSRGNLGVRRNLNKHQNKSISSKRKQDKNNSSSNAMVDYNNKKMSKAKIVKKGGKIRCPYFKPSVDKIPLQLTSRDMFNNSFVNGPYRQRIKIPAYILDMQDSISMSIDVPSFVNYRTKFTRNLLNESSQKKTSQLTSRKKVVTKRKSCKCLINDACSQTSLSSSMSAHNQLTLDNKEETMNKYFAEFFNNLTKKAIKSKNWMISNRNLDFKLKNCNKDNSKTKEKSNQLITDIFELVRIFVKDKPETPVNNESTKTLGINSIKENIDPKLQMTLIPKIHFKDSFGMNVSQSTATILSMTCFNSLPNLFFEHVYMPLNQVAITTNSSLAISNRYSKSVVNFIKSDLYFSQILQQIFIMNIPHYFTLFEYVKKRLRTFNKMHSEFFSDEALKIFSVNIQIPLAINKLLYSPCKKFYSDIFELETENDHVFPKF